MIGGRASALSAQLLLMQRGKRDSSSAERANEGGMTVLYTLAVVLLILWLLGMVSGYTVGAFIHVLLVIALVLILVQVITGRRPAL